MSAEYDLILWGATGFTGSLVAEYLVNLSKADDLTVALGGRDRAKLERLRDSLSVRAERPVALVIADAGDAASMASLAKSARVVCSTVGPFARRGSNLVAACAAAGTDYCDITGEVHWARRMIDAHDEEARRTGAHILHFCGYDSIPSDLGTWMLHDHLRRAHGARLRKARHLVTNLSGSMSGGSLATMTELFEDIADDPEVGRIAANPYALYPASEPAGLDGRDALGVGFARELDSFTAPFLMASVNSRVVRWTNASLDFPYGRDFRYEECMGTGGGLAGAARAAAVSVGLIGFGAGLAVPLVRRGLQRYVLPAPGRARARRSERPGASSPCSSGRASTARVARCRRRSSSQDRATPATPRPRGCSPRARSVSHAVNTTPRQSPA